MNFPQSIRTCFKKYAVFKGRATRSEFWWFQLFLVAVEFLAVCIDSLLLGYSWTDDMTPMVLLTDIALIVPMAAVTARRLHDVGMSGWFQIPMLMSYLYYLELIWPNMFDYTAVTVVLIAIVIYLVWLLIKLIKDSDLHANRYGPSPKSEGVAEAFS